MRLLYALTTGSNRSLRSLGWAKARPLTKRYAVKPREMVYLLFEQFGALLLPILQRLHGREVS